jgi:hypothetical protein
MSLRDYGIAAPHGPNPDGDHVATQNQFDHLDMSQNESAIFQSILKPDDMYNEEGVYWADMPLGQKISFVNSNELKETKRELAIIGNMIKADPLSPLGAYMRNMVIPGAGLLLEGYVRDLCQVRPQHADLTVQLCTVLDW